MHGKGSPNNNSEISMLLTSCYHDYTIKHNVTDISTAQQLSSLHQQHAILCQSLYDHVLNNLRERSALKIQGDKHDHLQVQKKVTINLY